MKYTQEALQGMALQLVQMRNRGDERYMKFVQVVAGLTGEPSARVQRTIIEYSEGDFTFDPPLRSQRS